MLSQSMHNACILPHHEVQENPLRGKETLHPLLRPALRPTRQVRNKRWSPRVGSGALVLYRCWHIIPPFAAPQHQLNYTKRRHLCQYQFTYFVQSNIGKTKMELTTALINKYGNRRLYDGASSRLAL